MAKTMVTTLTKPNSFIVFLKFRFARRMTTLKTGGGADHANFEEE